MARYDVTNGQTSTGITLYDDSMYVSKGGKADNTTVNADGELYVLSGGKADHTTVNADAYTLYGRLYVSSGGTATNTTVNEWGELLVFSGGTATNTTVNSKGWLNVWSGGTATGITAVDGAQLDFSVAPGTYVKGTSAGSAFEIKDGVANNFTLKNGDLNLRYGGKADNTTVNEWSHLEVYSGCTATNTTVNSKGWLYVYSGGTATKTTVNAYGDIFVSSGGTADNTTVKDYGRLFVSSGGTANKTTVSSGGAMAISGTANSTTVDGDVYVWSGGTMNSNTIDYWGDIYIKDGGVANNTTINYGGGLTISNGGFASNTTLASPGFLTYAKPQMWVLYGGSADRITIQSTGALYVQIGGSATNIIAEDGAYLVLSVSSGTYAKGTSNGIAFENQNGYISGYTIDHGYLGINSGGTAVKTTVNDMCFVDYFGVASNTTVNANGRFFAEEGGLAESTTVKSDGSLMVCSGGTANSMTVSSGGKLWFGSKGGTLTGRMTFSAGAIVSAEDEAVIDFDLTHTSPTAAALVNDLSLVQGTPMYTLTVNGAQGIGAYRLADGASGFGSKTEITVRNPVGTDLGVLTVDSKSNTFSYGGKSYTLQLNDASLVIIVNSESGSPNIVTGDVNGQTVITEGSSALGVNVNGGGELVVQDGGKGNNIMINNGGILMATDAQLKGVTVDKGGVAYLGSDAIAKSLVLNGGEAHVESDGWAFQMSKGKTVSSNTIVKNDGMLYISGGGHVEGLLASDGGRVIVESDGSLEVAKFAGATLDALGGAGISSATLLEGGRMNVFAGGSAQNVTVSEGGILSVESGGELNNIYVSAGGVLTGVVKDGTMIRMYGGTLDFDISGFTPDSAPAYLYEDTDIESDEAYPCTLTVGDAQAYGTYGLMSYAYGFGCTVTVQNTSGKELGTLAAGSAVNINGVDYTLNIGGSPAYPLTVTIADNEAPTITNIAADITDPTTSNVTVTAEFSDNVALASKQYRIGDGAWTDYATGVTVTENATVYFKAVDTAGNVTEEQYAVTNIDREKPEVKNIQLSTIEFTNQDVTVTADFTDNMEVAAKQYRIGDGAWTDYTTGVVVTENTTVYFKATDTAGNESDVVPCDVPIIDKVPPTITITPSTTEPGAESVTLSVVCEDETSMSSILQYRIGDGAWQDCTADVVVTENTTVSFKTYDTAGNETIESYAVTNIKVIVPDTTKPTVTNVKADITAPTNGNVTVTADYWDDVALLGRQYRIDDFPWTEYPDGGAVIEDNATVSFKAVDTSENESEIVSIVISNIDKVKPTISYITPSTLAPAASVTVTAFFADEGLGLATKQYRIGSGVWQDYTDAGVTVTENVTVYFKAVDTAGNETIENYVVSNIETVVPDTTKPVVSNVKANITAATNKNVTVTAEFTDDVAVKSSLYRIGSGAWQNYTGGVTVTENTTVYFKAIDTSDNESEVVSIAVTNIDKVAPEKPTVTASVTKPTNGSVNVTAAFADDSVKNEYSLDGVNWAQYPGAVKFDDNGTVYFRGTDAVGNVSEVASYTVSNIDKVAPAKPTASADITSTTSGNVTVTAKFSSDSAKKEFSLDGLVWQAYTAPLVFSENGRAYFRGTDAAGNASEIISYEVRNIQAATPDNAPDDGRNDMLYNKKAKEWASEENIASFVVNNITAGDSEVRLDKAGSVDDGKGGHNFVGRTGSDEDAADYAKIQLSKGAALTFSVDSTVAGTFYVYQTTTDKKGNLVPAQRHKISVKAGQTSPKKTATIFLEAGEYFVGMEAKLPAAKKNPEVSAYYSVNLAGTTFFDDADSGWNNSAYKLDAAGKEVKTELNPELVGSALAFGRGVTSVKLDAGATGQDGYDNWVGFSDSADYRMLTLENDANVTLSLTATGKTKLTIWKVSRNAKNDTISLSSRGSTTAKADKAGTIKAKFLEAGTYFVSVESTDAKKGGGAYYNVTVDSDVSVFFDSGDDGRNDELYDKKGKAFYGEDETCHFETTNVSGSGINVKLDSDPVKADGYKNYVGYGDKTDYAKINLRTDGSLYFKIKATGDATFTVYRKGQDKKGNDTLEAIQTTKLKLAKGASVVDKFTDAISDLAAGEYYISMTAANTSNNAKGSVFYNVTATLEPSVMASLAMPETDSLGISDALSLGQYDADALASASASALTALDDKSAWQSMLA